MDTFLTFIPCPKDPREAAFMAVWREEVVKKLGYKYQQILIMPQVFFTGGKETWLQSQADQVANVEQSK